MFPCRSKKTKPVVANPAKPVPTIGPDDNTPIGIIVGHNVKAQGAVNYLGESEYIFNKRIARKVQENLASKGIKSVILERPTGSYSSQCQWVANKCEELDVAFAISLHFNSASGQAKGCECLVLDTSSPRDNVYGDFLTDELHRKLGIVERGSNGVKTIYKGHNGYGMLEALRKKGTTCVLIEPTFANYRHKESIAIFEREDNYVNILVKSLTRIAMGEI